MAVDRGEFRVCQDGMVVAGGSGPMKQVRSEAAHYGVVYGQDGPVEVQVRMEGQRWPRLKAPRP